jgi:hypothetical protein
MDIENSRNRKPKTSDIGIRNTDEGQTSAFDLRYTGPRRVPILEIPTRVTPIKRSRGLYDFRNDHVWRSRDLSIYLHRTSDVGLLMKQILRLALPGLHQTQIPNKALATVIEDQEDSTTKQKR